MANEDLNFLLTNRIPRHAVTRFMGWFSQIQNPWLTRFSIRVWKVFTDLDLGEAKQQSFQSLHECFIRELKPGARPIDQDPGVFCSPCDGILGAHGTVREGQVYQAKGFPYSVDDLFQDRLSWAPWRDGVFATIRITSAMYHRFHAPYDGRLHQVNYISGDTWNVNPIALRRVERLFCKNERALLSMTLAGPNGVQHPIALVPVAAIMVASIRIHGLDLLLRPGHKGQQEFRCDLPFQKGDEMGWFQHGSTIIVFAPKGFEIAQGLQEGARLRMGQALLRLPQKS